MLKMKKFVIKKLRIKKKINNLKTIKLNIININCNAIN